MRGEVRGRRGGPGEAGRSLAKETSPGEPRSKPR